MKNIPTNIFFIIFNYTSSYNELMIRLNKKQSVYILAIILAVLQIFFNKNNPVKKLRISQIVTPKVVQEKQKVKVIRAVDGDTIEIEGNIKIRYIGINTPELHDPKKPVECFGEAAYIENKRLVEGKEISIQKDVSETDKYKRLLRYVWVGDVFVNDYLVRQGFAQASTFPPDVKYAAQFLEAQRESRENKRGLWNECLLGVGDGKKGQ
jgi:micrococcal nuclease